jgi:hypothetical protein
MKPSTVIKIGVIRELKALKKKSDKYFKNHIKQMKIVSYSPHNILDDNFYAIEGYDIRHFLHTKRLFERILDLSKMGKIKRLKP